MTSPLNSNVLLEAGLAAGQAARATEQRKHDENDAKCKELGWIASPWWLRHIVLGGQKQWSHFHFWPLALQLAPTGLPLITPILNILFGIPFPICIGSTLSRTAGTSFSTALRYWKFGDIDAKLALMIVGGNFVGIELGVYLLDWLDKLGEISVGKQSIPALQFYLQWLFFGVLITVSGLILIESLIHRGKIDHKQPLGLLRRLPIPPYVSFPNSGVRQISLPAIVYSALVIGIFTGLLGIGGGILFVPLLIYGYGVETHAAVGTASLIVFFSAAYGTVTHAMRGNVDLWLVVFLLIGSTICAQVGAIVNQRIQGDSIRFCFAFIVLIVAGMIGFNLLRAIYG